MNESEYASAYYGGKTVVEKWKLKHEVEMNVEQVENDVRIFLETFRTMFPQQYEEILKRDPNARAAARAFGKEM